MSNPPDKGKEIKQLTVGELIKELGKWDKSRRVLVEGCDCYQRAAFIEDEFDGEGIVIRNVLNADD